MEAIRLRTRPRKPSLRIFREVPDPPPDIGVVGWQIDGHPAEIQIWSAALFARLADPPQDARPYPGGVWCRLVIL